MTKKGLIILVGVVGVIGLVVFIFTGGIGEKNAAISITAYPSATVYIDGKEAGATPYGNDKISAGEKAIKLVPEQGDISASWERNVFLNPNTETFINWDFNADPELTGGRVIYLEKTSLKDKAGLIVSCKPDECSVSVDGQMRGFSPINLEDIGEGKHRISVSAPNYKEVEIMSQAINGYRLVTEIDLAKQTSQLPEEQLEPTPTETETGPTVVIKNTPTGWLRVREGPGTTYSELTKIDPGEEFSFLEEDSGWYKIEYEEGKEGWISSRYADKLE